MKDGFLLALGRELCPAEYEPVKKSIVEDFKVAAAAGTAGGFQQTIESARKSDGWNALLQAVFDKADEVGSDLNGIWMRLEMGRMEWLAAVGGAHALKVKLKEALESDKQSSEADEQAAKMVWMYALALNVQGCRKDAEEWAKVAKIKSLENPLIGYEQDRWDCRRDEWRPIDLGVQAAAERGGADNLDDAWKA